MNYIVNQSNERVLAIGQEDSIARARIEFNITFPKLIQRIINSQAWSSVSDTSEYRDCQNICEDDNIPKEKWITLIILARREATFTNECKS